MAGMLVLRKLHSSLVDQLLFMNLGRTSVFVLVVYINGLRVIVTSTSVTTKKNDDYIFFFKKKLS